MPTPPYAAEFRQQMVELWKRGNSTYFGTRVVRK